MLKIPLVVHSEPVLQEQQPTADRLHAPRMPFSLIVSSTSAAPWRPEMNIIIIICYKFKLSLR
jgi:hypothetical protein